MRCWASALEQRTQSGEVSSHGVDVRREVRLAHIGPTADGKDNIATIAMAIVRIGSLTGSPAGKRDIVVKDAELVRWSESDSNAPSCDSTTHWPSTSCTF